MLIQGDKTYLDAFGEEDVHIIKDWMNQFELRRLAWTECTWPSTMEEAQNWIRSMNHSERTRLLALRKLDNDELIGFFTARNISWISRSMRFGSLIWPPAYWNQGMGTDARKAFLEYAFNYLGMQRVYGFFAGYNIASQRSHEKLGASVTVAKRDAVYMDGKFYDAYCYVYCRENFFVKDPKSFAVREKDFTDEDLKRTYHDFYGVPEEKGKTREWISHQNVIQDDTGELVFLVDPIKRSADLLFFPLDKNQVAPLIRLAVDKAIRSYNLHRIQVCLPSSADIWVEPLVQSGFSDEGRIPGIIYSNGTYLDLCFFGLVFQGS